MKIIELNSMFILVSISSGSLSDWLAAQQSPAWHTGTLVLTTGDRRGKAEVDTYNEWPTGAIIQGLFYVWSESYRLMLLTYDPVERGEFWPFEQFGFEKEHGVVV